MLSFWIDMELEAIQMVVFDLMYASVGVQIHNLMIWSVLFLVMAYGRLNMPPWQNNLWFT